MSFAPDDRRSDDAEFLRHDAYVATVITGGDGLLRLHDIADRYEKMEAALREYADRNNWDSGDPQFPMARQGNWKPRDNGWQLAEEALK